MHRIRQVLATLLPSIFFSLFFLVYIFFNVGVKSSLVASKQSTLNHTSFSLLIGILTRPDNYDRRHFLRLVYGIQSSPIAEIDMKFVFCKLTKDEQRLLISLEILRYNDIIILNCTENMNSGKTYKYFSSLPYVLSRRYDYVMKADDDEWGFCYPWDLVEWIGSSDIPANNTYGPEDKLVGKWLNLGNKAKNRFSNKPAMYDYPGTNGRCSHELIPETIAVHRLKRWDQWRNALLYFNVTRGTSSFHHVIATAEERINLSGDMDPSPSRLSSDLASESPSSANIPCTADSPDPDDQFSFSPNPNKDSETQSSVSLKSEEYRQLFRLPPDEVLVQDFNCAYQESILLQGHMYLFDHYICFYSNIFGFETKKIVPFHEITIVRRAKTAGIFPNAIEIFAGGRKYFFASFLSRDEAFKLINDGWLQHGNVSQANSEQQYLSSETSSPENGPVVIEQVNGSNNHSDKHNSIRRSYFSNYRDEDVLDDSKRTSNVENDLSTIPLEIQEDNVEQDAEPIVNVDSSSSAKTVSWKIEDYAAPKKFKLSCPMPLEIGDLLMVDEFHFSGLWKWVGCASGHRHWMMFTEADYHFKVLLVMIDNVKFFLACFACCDSFLSRAHTNMVAPSTYAVVPECFAKVAETKFPMKVEEFFYLLFSDDAVNFTESFHRKCGDKGAKFGSCQEIQKFRVYKNSHLVIESSQEINDVPYGDYFRVQALWDVERYDNESKEGCILRVYVNVAFSKKTVWKGKIVQSTLEECREAYEIWIGMAHDFLKQKNIEKQEEVGPTASSVQNVDVYTDREVKTGESSERLSNIDDQLRTVPKNQVKKFCSYLKSQNRVSLILVIAFAVIILMQVSILVLLNRPQHIQVVSPLDYMGGGIGERSAETTAWLEKRMHYVKDEMLMVEVRLERMRREYALLKAQFKDLQHLRSSQ
ncbi:hypothetical protein Patl1_00107 [Pistacia atlantica]|uniref:Uncharacterized protein n=1 Tax=Pistacia atlantica TaxID=434234 RepID=A0ACC1CA76_9ROSI|nr:hypothetical protein Patl1_00107 [Pistacia atlantica]